MTSPKISVLMVNYNHDTHISSAIESVLSQTYKNIQFIIVDDGSTDSSREIIQNYARKDSRIEPYFLPENRHICHATNFGFSKIKGEYTARIDSDDLWYPDRLQAQLDYMTEIPDCEICFSTIDLIDENGDVINEKEFNLHGLFQIPVGPNREDWLRFFFFEGNNLCHSSVLMKSRIIEEIGGFHLAYRQIHDFEYWVRIAKKYPIYVMRTSYTALRRFLNSDIVNTSSTNETDTTRYINEYFMLRQHFFEGMEDELFIRTFGAHFQNPDAATREELECEKAFLLCGCSYLGVKIPLAGLLRLEHLFTDSACTDTLERVYRFTPIDYYRLSGEHLLNDHYLHAQQSRIESLQKELEDCRESLSHANQYARNLEENVTLLNQNTDALNETINTLTEALDSVTSSTIWKASAPLRSAIQHFKK